MQTVGTYKQTTSAQTPWMSHIAGRFARRWDKLLLTSVLFWTNFSLLGGFIRDDLVYLAEPVARGEWWRLMTYPFVHLSWYHLALDAGAFFLLYDGLRVLSIPRKMLILLVCSALSLLFGIWLGDAQRLGLAGLSGIDHGLMAFAALEMIVADGRRKAGLLALILVAAKSVYELAAGGVLFEALHMGLCGTPVAACHAGGALGGILAFALLRAWRKQSAGNAASHGVGGVQG